MALTLIKEDGTGMADANTYALAADGDAYHEGHLYASAWSGATTANKEKALAMATRVVDAVFRFHGAKRLSTQALQWPRQDCPDPDSDECLDETTVPPAVLQATCEVARKLLEEDWTVDPDGTGLRSLSISGSVRVVFDGRRLRAIVPDFVQALLGRLGQYMGGGQAAVRLVRV